MHLARCNHLPPLIPTDIWHVAGGISTLASFWSRPLLIFVGPDALYVP